MILFAFIFWFCILLVIYNYIFFPLFVIIKSNNKEISYKYFSKNQSPEVSIIVAAYNEEEVIKEKIFSILNSNYDLEKIEILIGSDNSTDQTNTIVKQITETYKQVKLIEFKKRTGKPKIVDTLKNNSKHNLIILTDANVFFEKDTIYEITKYFADHEIGLVGGNIINQNIKKTGISRSENQYLALENRVKYGEGLLYGYMIGAFGGIYCLNKKYYTDVPKGFISDDFFISMNVFLKGKKAILNKNAICYEDISNNMADEFKRKTRIAIGNFQNLFYLIKKRKHMSFLLKLLFFSHKIIRWLTPFLLIIIFISLSIIKNESSIFELIFYVNIIFYSTVLIDYLLKKINIHSKTLRTISHFITMNIALLVGFFKFLAKPKNNIWTPTKRNQ